VTKDTDAQPMLVLEPIGCEPPGGGAARPALLVV